MKHWKENLETYPYIHGHCFHDKCNTDVQLGKKYLFSINSGGAICIKNNCKP